MASEEAPREFEREWRAEVRASSVNDLLKRAIARLLARLELAGLADVELWSVSGAIEGKGRGADQHGTHWVLVRGAEMVDVSARQFDADAPHGLARAG